MKRGRRTKKCKKKKKKKNDKKITLDGFDLEISRSLDGRRDVSAVVRRLLLFCCRCRKTVTWAFHCFHRYVH